MRARSCHADVHHGRDRPGGAGGVLFRDAEAIERLRTIDTLIIDKTGTLTQGRPAFREVIGHDPCPAEEVLRLAASLDQGSEHPLADAIVAEARRRGLSLTAVEDFESLTRQSNRFDYGPGLASTTSISTIMPGATSPAT